MIYKSNRIYHMILLVLVLTLSLLASSCALAGGGVTAGQGTVPMTVIKGSGGSIVATVDVMIEGQGPFSFTVDTGASQSVVDSSVTRQLNLPVTGRPERITGVAGSTQASLVKIDSWSVGNVDLPSTTLVSLNLPEVGRGEDGGQGLLGSDILSQFGVVTIDFQNQQLTLGATH